MRNNDYHYTPPQLAVMSDNLLSEAMTQLLTDFAIYWDENDRPSPHWLSIQDVESIASIKPLRQVLQHNMRIMRDAELLQMRGGGRLYRVSLTPDGEAAAKYILDSKDKRRYVRLPLTKDYPGRGRQKIYTMNVWRQGLAAFAKHIIKVDTRGAYGEDRYQQVYVESSKLEENTDYLDRSGLASRPDYTPKMPKIMQDKIALYKGKDLPAWLQFEIKQYQK